MAYTFTTLKTAIQDYTQNTETTFVSQLSRFIINAEERILKECELPFFRKYVSGQTTNGNKFLSKPLNDFLSPFSLSVVNDSKNEFLLYKHVTFLQDYTPNLAPTPSANFNMELHYFYRPTSITATTDGTSWLGTNAELALLYGSLVEAYTFMKGEADMLQLYNARYAEALKWLKNLGEGRDTRDSYRYDNLRRDIA